MKTRLICILLFSTLTLAAQQSSKEELEKKRKAALAEIEATTQLLNENKKTTSNAINLLNLRSKQIQARREVIVLLNKEIQSIDEEIHRKEVNVKTLERELKVKKDSYSESLRKMYSHKNNQDKLLFVLSAQNISQSYRRILYLREYSNWQKQKAEDIIDKHKRVEEEKTELLQTKEEKLALLEGKIKEEDKLKEEEDSYKIEIQDLKKEQKTLLSELNKKKKEAEALNREIDKIIAEEIARAERAERAARATAEAQALALAKKKNEKKAKTTTSPSNEVHQVEEVKKEPEAPVISKENTILSLDFEKNKGRLPSPIKGNYTIVKHFGLVKHADLQYVTTTNHGIDLQTSAGNMACSVFDGEVLSIFKVPGFGTANVIILHGNYMTIYANLSEVNIQKGDKVKTGQIIGKIATDPGNGTILHFEIRHKETKLDPEYWLAR